jgi:hypothetical protein
MRAEAMGLRMQVVANIHGGTKASILQKKVKPERTLENVCIVALFYGKNNRLLNT